MPHVRTKGQNLMEQNAFHVQLLPSGILHLMTAQTVLEVEFITIREQIAYVLTKTHSLMGQNVSDVTTPIISTFKH